jgi:RNA polymerase sigma-70 factor (ECF subfamily)
MNQDAVLIEKTLAGQSEAYAQLVKKYQLPVYALALKRTRSAATAEDIAQVVFVTAFQKLAQLKDRKKFGAWLRSITIRQSSMHFRSETQNKRILRQLELEDHATRSTDPNTIPAFNQPVFGIESFINALPEGLRAAAVLCFVEGVSPGAAASVLGLEPNALRKRLFDARVRLQRQIVKKAEKELQLHLLPKDFADRCVCRCQRAVQSKKKGGDNDGG